MAGKPRSVIAHAAVCKTHGQDHDASVLNAPHGMGRFYTIWQEQKSRGAPSREYESISKPQIAFQFMED